MASARELRRRGRAPAALLGLLFLAHDATAGDPQAPPAPKAAADGAVPAKAAAPETVGAILGRIDRLKKEGDLAGALGEAEKALATAPHDVDLHVRRQDLLVALGRKDQALALYRDHAAGDPADGRRVYLVARLLSGDAALREFQRACEIDPLFAPAWREASGLLAAQRRWREAADALARAADLLRDPATRNSVGWLRERADQLEEAAASYRAALAADPDFALARRNLGYVLSRRGKTEEALQVLGEAVHRDPTDAMAWVAIGFVRTARGDYDGAVGAYNEALSSNSDPAVLNMLGSTYLKLERPDLAEKAFRKAISIRKDDAAAHLNLGCVRLEAGDAEAAEKEFREALRGRGPTNEANYYLGVLCDRTDRADEALGWYRKACEADPGNAAFASTFALALERKGRLPEALAWYRKAVEAAPSDAAPLFGAGVVLTKLKRWKEAEETLEAARSLKPKQARIHFYLGIVRAEGKHDDEAAKASFRKYVELGGDAEAVKPWYEDLDEKKEEKKDEKGGTKDEKTGR
jgi:tetratricopeptide (TPR) repeat protein